MDIDNKYNHFDQDDVTNNEQNNNEKEKLEIMLIIILLSCTLSQFYQFYNIIQKKWLNFIKKKNLNEFLLGENINESCSICLSELNKNDKCTKLNCDHIYHSKCIYEWFQYKQIFECPLCRIVM